MSTPPPAGDDPRERLLALWNTLASFGAVVRRADRDHLPADVLDALCAHEARRIRAVIEGLAAGWSPDWRTKPPADNDNASTPVVSAGTPPEDKARPVVHRVKRRRPRWSAIA